MDITCTTERFVNEVINRDEYAMVFHDLNVLDIGCNIGSFTFWIGPLAKHIWAVDIAEPNIQNLNHTIEVNRLTNISTYNAAIGGRGGMRYVTTDGIAGDGSWRLTDNKTDKQIECFTVAEFLGREGNPVIDIMKIDIEGGEWEVFEASDFPKDKVRCIVGEAHGENCAQRINEAMHRLGYRFYPYGSHFVARI